MERGGLPPISASEFCKIVTLDIVLRGLGLTFLGVKVTNDQKASITHQTGCVLIEIAT